MAGTDIALKDADGLELMELGRLLASSGFFADTKDVAQAVVKVLAGRELGFPAIASMTGINIIKGRVTLSANLIAAAIKRSGKYDYRVLRQTPEVCEIRFLQEGEDIGTIEFTITDAQRAGLAGGENWRKYPANMLFARALSNGAKFFTPDVFGGPIYTPDELDGSADAPPTVTVGEREVDAATGEILTGGDGAPSPGSGANEPPLPAADDAPSEGDEAHTYRGVQTRDGSTPPSGGITAQTMRHLHALGNELGLDHTELKKTLRTKIPPEKWSMAELSEEKALLCVTFLQNRIEALQEVQA